MTLPFLAAKTRLPAPNSNLVARPRLLASLDACLQPSAQVMLVAAPAGAGKTTLLAQWIQHLPADISAGWLSLDESDNSLARFLAYAVAAMPSISGDLAAQIESAPAIKTEQAVAYLVEQVAEAEQNLLLVLDDYHVITNPEVHQALKLLIDHLPPNLRLVIAGRVEPPLPLARLRARGQLVEIRAADLRFHVDETTDFLAHFAGLESLLAQESLSKRLTDSTEGWAAGLQMSALALRGELSLGNGEQAQVLERFVDQLGESHRYILDYLLEEVLSRESDRVREFLLRTCLVERFNADLCAALCSEETDAVAAQSMLETLERANLFIVPLDSQRAWFRFHHLFADVLQKQLLHTRPGLAPELHRRAASWFEAQNMLEEALSQAILSGDPYLPAAFVEKYALEAILQGHIASATRWLDALPAEVIYARPRLCLDRAWALTFTSQTEAAIPYLERAEALLGHENLPGIKSEVFGLQSYRETMYGRADEALRLARLALENAPGDSPFATCCNRLFLAGALSHAGRLDEALQTYRLVQPQCQMSAQWAGLALIEADFLQYLAMYLNARGASGQAKDLLWQAIQDFETKASGNRKAAALYLYVGLGKILFIENDLLQAERALETGLQLDPLAMSVGAFDGRLALWWVKIGQGDYPAARHILEQLAQITRGRDEKTIRLVTLTGALQDLIEEKIEQAAASMARLGFSGTVDDVLTKVSDSELMSWRSNEFFTYARLLAAQRQTAASQQVLERLEQAAKDFNMGWLLSRVWLMQAIVHYQDGRTDTALEIMARLLEHTSQMESNPARVYLMAGDEARVLLKEAQRSELKPRHVARLLAEFPPEANTVNAVALPESLTERELDVLRLMADGLKNQEIGAKLFISLNTIRYHTTNIFGKLGVDNRTAAVARARELGIL